MEIKEDFLGFKFANVDSESLGIVRVSSSDRYDESLQPDIKDVTAEIPGMDGEYYFGSTFGPRTFEIEFAFDSMTEEQFRQMRKVFGRKQQSELIFNERPYKKYLAKIESPIELSYVCFDEKAKTVGAARDGVRVTDRTPITEEVDGEQVITGYSITREQVTPFEYSDSTRRVYKGEGKISFICYFPFAKSVFKVLPTDEEDSDWAVSSGILNSTLYSLFDTYSAGAINIYNAGDLPTGFRLYIPFNGNTIDAMTISYYSVANNEDYDGQLKLNQITKIGNDVGILINTDNELIQGVAEIGTTVSGNVTYKTSGHIYNQYVDAGHFFKLLPNLTHSDGATIEISNDSLQGVQIFYDYLYF